MSADGPALKLRGFRLSFASGRGETVILDGVDLDVPRGRFYLLVGPSGSGKSSLMKLVTGLWERREPAPSVGGALEVLGVSVVSGEYPRGLRGRVQAVLQEEGLLDELSPRKNVELGLRVAGRSPKLALGLLAQAGLDHPPPEVAALSGGMRKRVAVARALAGEPELLLFDEPTAGLDAESAREMAALLRSTHDAAKGARTTIVITHDVTAFRQVNDGVLVVRPGDRQVRLVAMHELELLGSEDVAGPHRDDEAPPLYAVQRALLEVAGLLHTLVASVVRLPPVYPGMAARTIGRYLAEAALFVVVGCAAIGGLATFFALRSNPLEGAYTAAVLTGCGKALVAVLIPLLAGFFFTARIAAGAAARLGTMKRTSQVAALELMGIRPSDYLLTPLVWGITIAMPLISAAGVVAASLASMFAAVQIAGVSEYGWATAYTAALSLADVRMSLVKTGIAGFLVATLTFHLAMGPKRSGRDVGHAVNRAIVVGIFSVLLVHGALTILQYG